MPLCKWECVKESDKICLLWEDGRTAMPSIVLENVTKFYKWERRLRAAVQGVSLTINQGEFVFLIGSRGAGKSTLLKLISGQAAPDWGRIIVGDRYLRPLKFWSRSRGNPMFGVVWQESTLVRRRTVEENLAAAIRVSDRAKLVRSSRGLKLERGKGQEERIQKVLGLVGMRGVEKKYPVELTNPECRKVELARAMINSPPILLLDDITEGMDDDSIWEMFLLLRELNRRGTTVIMVTRASEYVNIMRKRVITLVDGRIFGDVKDGRYGDVV